MPFASTRRRSRGIVSKESSGIWKVENERIDSMREGYRIKERRLSSNELSDESINEEGERRTRITKSRLKAYDEVIGVRVPRRARSGSKRRSQDVAMAAQLFNGSIGANLETTLISESELEVANLLCGLTTLHSQHSNAMVDTLLSSPVPDIAALPRESKRRKSSTLPSDDTEKPSAMINCQSNLYTITNKVNATSSVCSLSIMNGHEAESTAIKEAMLLSPKHGEDASFCNTGQSKIELHMRALQYLIPTSTTAEEKPSPTSPINSELFSSPDHSELPSPTFSKQGERKSIVGYKAQNRPTEQLNEKEPNQLKQDLTSLSSHDDKLHPHKSASPDSLFKGGLKKVKYEIDLMAPPDDGEIDAIEKCNFQASHFNLDSVNYETVCSSDTVFPSSKDTVNQRPNQDSSLLNLDKEPHLKGVTKETTEEQIITGGKTETQDEKKQDKAGAKLDSQRTEKAIRHPLENSGPSNIMSAQSTPTPISIPCWPGGIRPFRFPTAGLASSSVLPSLQGASRVEGNSAMLHAPLVMLPPQRPGRCATHCFIAQQIHFQQQLTKVNPFWHGAGGPSGKPYGITSLPPPGALVLGGPFIRNPNALSSSSSVSGSVVPLNSQYPTANCADSLQDHGKGKHLGTQKSHQGGVFLFPVNQMNSLPMLRTRAGHISENGSSLPTFSSLSTVSGLTSTNSSNLVANADARYVAMFKGNYPFSNTPTHQSYHPQQQGASTPLFYSNSSHVYSSQNPSISTGSSSQKSTQKRPFLHSPKNSSDSIPKPEHSRNVEVPHSQRKPQNYMLIGKQCQPMNPLQNQANTPLRTHANSSSEPSELNNVRKQILSQTKAPMSNSSTSMSTAASMAYFDHFNSQRKLSSEKMSKPCPENISSSKDLSLPSITAAAKTQQSQFPNIMPAHQNASGKVLFTGSLNVKSTISQQAQLGSSMGLTKMAAGSYAQGAATLQIKSAGEKPTAA